MRATIAGQMAERMEIKERENDMSKLTDIDHRVVWDAFAAMEKVIESEMTPEEKDRHIDRLEQMLADVPRRLKVARANATRKIKKATAEELYHLRRDLRSEKHYTEQVNREKRAILADRDKWEAEALAHRGELWAIKHRVYGPFKED